MLTSAGAELIWQAVNPASWSLAVTDGAQRAVKPVETATIDGEACVLACTFSGDEANFEWTAREVVASDGTLVDSEVEDNGRKAPGAEWRIEVVLTIGAAMAAGV